MNNNPAGCYKCGGELKPSMALENTPIRSTTRGQTIVRTGPALLVKVTKCSECGHSTKVT